jgi:hypothetical protein
MSKIAFGALALAGVGFTLREKLKEFQCEREQEYEVEQEKLLARIIQMESEEQTGVNSNSNGTKAQSEKINCAERRVNARLLEGSAERSQKSRCPAPFGNFTAVETCPQERAHHQL